VQFLPKPRGAFAAAVALIAIAVGVPAAAGPASASAQTVALPGGSTSGLPGLPGSPFPGGKEPAKQVSNYYIKVDW
jgi:hypothetical protein